MFHADDQLLLECPQCFGMGTRALDCECVFAGNVTVVTDPPGSIHKGPFDRCRRCRGRGSVTMGCHSCQGAGRVRAQHVLTMVHVGTGRIASATVIPGAIEVTATDDGTAECLDLRPVVADLARQVGAGRVDRVDPGPSPDCTRVIPLDPVDLSVPEPERQWYRQAVALARHASHRHQLLLARDHGPEPVDPDTQLYRLCRLASRLCVDLVVRHVSVAAPGTGRRSGWAWRLGLRLPTENPDEGLSAPTGAGLAELLSVVLPEQLLTRLDSMPTGVDEAHFLEPRPFRPDNIGSTAGLLDRMVTARDPREGSIALWRNDSWHVSPVIRDSVVEKRVPLDTGQIRVVDIPVRRMAVPPPVPLYWGRGIASRSCPRCDAATGWTGCGCVADGRARPGCPVCLGTGQTTDIDCPLCENVGEVRCGHTVTVADSDGWVRHLRFDPDRPVEDPPSDVLARALPRQYRLPDRLAEDGIDVTNLTTMDNLPIPATVLTGTTPTPPGATTAQSVQQSCMVPVGRGGRRFLKVRRESETTVETLVAIAWGLGLDLVAGCVRPGGDTGVADRAGAMRWSVALVAPHRLTADLPSPDNTGWETAVSRCAATLDEAIRAESRSTGTAILPAPHRIEVPRPVLDDLAAVLARQATRWGGFASGTVFARLSADRTTIAVRPSAIIGHPIGLEILAHAPDPATALARLSRD